MTNRITAKGRLRNIHRGLPVVTAKATPRIETPTTPRATPAMVDQRSLRPSVAPKYSPLSAGGSRAPRRSRESRSPPTRANRSRARRWPRWTRRSRPGRVQDLHLLRRRSLSPGDDGPRVSHAAAWGRRLAANESDHGLLHPGADERGGFLLGGAADLADHHDRARLRVVVEEAEDVDERGAVDGIAADPDTRRLADPPRRQLTDDLVGQRAAARDDADVAALVDVTGHDADLGLAGRDEAGTVRADEPARRSAHEVLRAHHVADGNPLGDADDQRH